MQLDSLLNTLLSLVTAFVLGTLIGLERQYRQRTAGLRTNVLVAVGAAIFVDSANTIAGADGTHTETYDRVVNAAGPFADKIAQMLGVDLPVSGDGRCQCRKDAAELLRGDTCSHGSSIQRSGGAAT